MTDLEKAARQALEVLEYWDVRGEFDKDTRAAITDLRIAIEQAEKQEPVGRVCFGGDEVVWTGEPPETGTLLYTTPPAAQTAPVKVWDAKGYDSLMQQMEMVKTENHRLTALVRAQQSTIDKLEAQRQWVWLEDKDFEGVVSSASFEAGARWANIVLQEKNGGNL